MFMSSGIIYVNNFICGAVVAILVYKLGADPVLSFLPSPLNIPILALAIMGGVICLVVNLILDRLLEKRDTI